MTFGLLVGLACGTLIPVILTSVLLPAILGPHEWWACVVTDPKLRWCLPMLAVIGTAAAFSAWAIAPIT